MKIITARIRRMREGNIFSLFVSPHPVGGGGVGVTPVPCSFPGPFHGGTPVPGSFSGHWSQVLSGVYPSPRFFPRSPVPAPFLGVPQYGGTSPLTRWGLGYPPPPSQARSGLGYPPTPGTEQQSKHLLRGGWYASCVHAVGLSCYW